MRWHENASANWIVERHADSLLHLAKISNFTSWKAGSSVLSFPKQMPDGLVDVTFPGRPSPDPFLIEIESYPDQETATQIRDDAAMVLLTRGVLADILLVVLSPKGNLNVSPEQNISSAHGLSELRLKIHVVNMWTLSAEELLAADDVGLIPWVPLTAYAGSPESLLQQCRDQIEKLAPPAEKGNLLATTRVMAEMRYNAPKLLSLLGEHNVTMEKIFLASPSVQFYMAKTACETTRNLVLHLLEKRFGAVPEDLAAHLRTVDDKQRLDELYDVAIDCSNLDEFHSAMSKPT